VAPGWQAISTLSGATADTEPAVASAASSTLAFVLAVLADNVESWTNSVANAAQAGAIVVGGWWTYNRFIREREEWPRATLEQRVQHRILNDRHTLLRVWLKVENVSNVLMPTEVVRTDVYQVLPVSEAVNRSLDDDTLVREGELEADWPCIGFRQRSGAGEIEPGEGDEFGFDFIIPSVVATAFIYSYIRNPKKEVELGWSVSSLYDLAGTRGEHRQRAERVGARRK
jgi:hypothetical protein